MSVLFNYPDAIKVILFFTPINHQGLFHSKQDIERS